MCSFCRKSAQLQDVERDDDVLDTGDTIPQIAPLSPTASKKVQLVSINKSLLFFKQKVSPAPLVSKITLFFSQELKFNYLR